MKRTIRQSGSTLLWMIGALVVLGAVAAGVALMSPSASRGKLEQEAGMRAYYNASSGLNYILATQATSQAQNSSFSNFVNAMGNGDPVNMTINGNDVFSYSLGNIIQNGTNGTYQITELVGSVKDASGEESYSYALYKSGEISSVKEYTISNNTSNSTPPGNYTNKMVFGNGGNYTGDYIFTSAEMAQGMILDGSIDYISETSSYSDGCFHMTGSKIGSTDNSSHICSNTCIVIDNGGKYYGTISSQGDITVTNGKIYGEIHSGGSVYLTWSSYIDNDIYVDDMLYFNGKAYSSVTISEIPKKVLNGNVYFNSGVPQKCKSYTLPEHEYYSGKAPYFLTYKQDNNWTGKDTIYGKKSLSDHSYEYSSFTTDNGTQLCFDLSGDHNYINIFVSGNITIGNGTVIYIKTIEGEDCFLDKNKLTKNNYSSFPYTSYASKVYFDVNGTSNINGGSNFFGTLYSKGNITFDGNAILGAMYTNGTMTSNGGVLSYFVASDYVNANWK